MNCSSCKKKLLDRNKTGLCLKCYNKTKIGKNPKTKFTEVINGFPISNEVGDIQDLMEEEKMFGFGKSKKKENLPVSNIVCKDCGYTKSVSGKITDDIIQDFKNEHNCMDVKLKKLEMEKEKEVEVISNDLVVPLPPSMQEKKVIVTDIVPDVKQELFEVVNDKKVKDFVVNIKNDDDVVRVKKEMEFDNTNAKIYYLEEKLKTIEQILSILDRNNCVEE